MFGPRSQQISTRCDSVLGMPRRRCVARAGGGRDGIIPRNQSSVDETSVDNVDAGTGGRGWQSLSSFDADTGILGCPRRFIPVPERNLAVLPWTLDGDEMRDDCASICEVMGNNATWHGLRTGSGRRGRDRRVSLFGFGLSLTNPRPCSHAVDVLHLRSQQVFASAPARQVRC